MNPRNCFWFGFFAVLGLFLISSRFAEVRGGDDKTPLVKEIALKGLKLSFPAKGGSPQKPMAIDSSADLAKAIFGTGQPDMEILAQITKQVDFKKQHLLYFRWAGSGQDKINPVVKMADKGALIVFEYTPGLTRDLRQHAKLFAVSRDAKWEVKTKPFKGK